MRYVLVCADAFLWELLGASPFGVDRSVYVVESAAVRGRITRHGGRAVAGDLDSPAVYRRGFKTGQEAAVVAAPRERRGRILAAVRAVAPAAPVVVVADEPGDAGDAPGITTVALRTLAERLLGPEVERAVTRARVERIRRHFEPAGRVLIMMQDDPDPDAIASALALRTLLGRTRATATLGTFGVIRRAENRAMTRILDIDVERLAPGDVAAYEAVAMVDTQPSIFEERFTEVDLVIDHHPEAAPVRARFRDIRPAYGATSTILTEYLRSVEAKFSLRLATALLYGIKADTLHLERDAGRADMEAFAFLHGHANHSALRRIERPEVPEAALDALAAGIGRRQVVDGAVIVHVGPLAYPELVAQFADLFLQVEGVEWSVVSGTVGEELHVSVRNVGYVRSAGDVVRQAFGDLGSAGGHRSMAKAVVRLRDWRRQGGPADETALGPAVTARFLEALRAAAPRGRP